MKDGDGAMLVDRLRVLAGNYRINRRGINAVRRSRYIYAGVYYNYWRCGEYIHGKHHPSAPISLREIDNFLHGHMKSRGSRFMRYLEQIGRAHVRTPVSNAHLVCRLLLEKKHRHI